MPSPISKLYQFAFALLSRGERVCPHCHLPARLPDVCTPEINDAINAQIERDWQTFEAGRQHGIKHGGR